MAIVVYWFSMVACGASGAGSIPAYGPLTSKQVIWTLNREIKEKEKMEQINEQARTESDNASNLEAQAQSSADRVHQQ